MIILRYAPSALTGPPTCYLWSMSAREGQLGNLTQRGHLLRAGKWPQLYLGPAELSQRPNELEKRFFRPASLLAGPEHGRTIPLADTAGIERSSPLPYQACVILPKRCSLVRPRTSRGSSL